MSEKTSVKEATFEEKVTQIAEKISVSYDNCKLLSGGRVREHNNYFSGEDYNKDYTVRTSVKLRKEGYAEIKNMLAEKMASISDVDSWPKIFEDTENIMRKNAPRAWGDDTNRETFFTETLLLAVKKLKARASVSK